MWHSPLEEEKNGILELPYFSKCRNRTHLNKQPLRIQGDISSRKREFCWAKASCRELPKRVRDPSTLPPNSTIISSKKPVKLKLEFSKSYLTANTWNIGAGSRGARKKMHILENGDYHPNQFPQILLQFRIIIVCKWITPPFFKLYLGILRTAFSLTLFIMNLIHSWYNWSWSLPWLHFFTKLFLMNFF